MATQAKKPLTKSRAIEIINRASREELEYLIFTILSDMKGHEEEKDVFISLYESQHSAEKLKKYLRFLREVLLKTFIQVAFER